MPASAPATAPARRRTPWWFRLIRLTLNLALLTVLGLQLFALVVIGTNHHLRLPAFVRRALETRLQEQGVTVRFSDLEVSLSGSLIVHDPKIFLADSTEPVIEADMLLAEPVWFALLFEQRLTLSDLRLINANFYCPPENSPTGLREPFITRLDTALHSQGARWWLLDHLDANFLNASIFAQGTFLIPANVTGPALSAQAISATYRQWARAALDLQPQLAQVHNPSLNISLIGAEPGFTQIHLLALAEHAHLPDAGLDISHARLHVNMTWDGRLLHATTPVFARIASATYTIAGDTAPTISLSSFSARVPLVDGPSGLLSAVPPHVALTVGSVQYNDYKCDSLTSNLDLTHWPEIPVDANVLLGPTSFHVTGNASIPPGQSLPSWQGNVDFQTESTPAALAALIQQPLPKELDGLTLDKPLQIAGDAQLDSDLNLQSANITLHARGIHYQSVDLDSLSAQGRVTRDAAGGFVLDLPHLNVANDSWHASATYFENFRTRDFRVTMTGDIDPRVLDPYLSFTEWWKPLWAFIIPTGHWPQINLAFNDNWDDMLAQNSLALTANITEARAHGILMDQISLRVLTEPNYVAVDQIIAHASGGGNLTGSMVWAMAPSYTKFIEQHCVFSSTLPLATISALGGPEITTALHPLDCPTPPTVQLDQRLGGSANAHPGAMATKIHAELATPFHAYHVPIDSVSIDLTDYGAWADVPRVDFTIAGGEGHANATVIHHPAGADALSFSGVVLGARDMDFVNAISQLATNTHASAPAPAATTSAPANAPPAKANPLMGDPAHPAKLDIVLGGQVIVNRPDSFTAAGVARLSGAQLGQLQLLGGLSRATADTKVALGNFNLTAATTDLQIAHQYIRLPNLTITGPSARVIAAGIYTYNADDLNFNVLILPLAEWDSFFGKGVSWLSSLLSNTLTLRVHGKITAPDWHVNVDPFRIFSNDTVECPVIPGYPTNPDGSPNLPPLPPAPKLP
ncbi:MAG TPA: hypothetical protein VK737_07895 [Opitutales bacterium]|nr:hypothetical protein [Opitutales bacterium]